MKGSICRRVQTALVGTAIAIVVVSCSSAGEQSIPFAGNEATGTVSSSGSGYAPETMIDLTLEEPPDSADNATLIEKATDSGFFESDASPEELLALESDSCVSLVDAMLAAHQAVLDDLGSAARTDIEVIDSAFEQSGMDGRLASERAEELECDSDNVNELTCESIDQLDAQGEAGEDLLAILLEACETD